MGEYTHGPNDFNTAYLDWKDEGNDITYDYYPYFLAEQIYQTPTTMDSGGGGQVLNIRPLMTVFEEPVFGRDGQLIFVRGE